MEDPAASLDALPASESAMQPPTLGPAEDTTSGLHGLMDHSPTSPMERLPVPTSEVVNQQTESKPAPRPTRSTRKTSSGHKRNYCEEEIHTCPGRYEQPYGKREREPSVSPDCRVQVTVSLESNPANIIHFYLKRHMNLFVSTPPCKTSSKNLQLEWDPAALFFDAIHIRHYGKMVNDSWSEDGNNCMIK